MPASDSIVYVCASCHHLEEARDTGELDTCPDCGSDEWVDIEQYDSADDVREELGIDDNPVNWFSTVAMYLILGFGILVTVFLILTVVMDVWYVFSGGSSLSGRTSEFALFTHV